MKILVGVDDSKFSEEALRAIVAQFRPQSTEIRLLHVLQSIAISAPPQMSARYAPELEDQGKQARELLDRAAKTLRSAGFKVDTAIEKGDVRLKIIDSAAEWNADLIVIGSHGRSDIPRLLLGSVAEFVARNALCSVEIVRAAVKK
jgi:nucleotide-binding universal stress UspA family protein